MAVMVTNKCLLGPENNYGQVDKSKFGAGKSWSWNFGVARDHNSWYEILHNKKHCLQFYYYSIYMYHVILCPNFWGKQFSQIDNLKTFHGNNFRI